MENPRRSALSALNTQRSSHPPELSNPCQNMENEIQSSIYRNVELYGTASHAGPFQMNNSPYQNSSAFQNMMTCFLAQQYTPFNPIGQPFPYYQMTTPPPPPPPPQVPCFPLSPYLNPGQNSFECVYSELNNHTQHLVKERTHKRKRPQETSDSDSSMENDRKKTKRK
ncbi:hypothetical protein JRQ81_019978 [Phrynocephalus forsythii]|uniref:Uncharacterized protein n=1 Tax=Phrynocephalus forsythii TaxID=171643 RepID=A0A9Q1AZ17_9SAUR|nr:hypothetical protein JRQ81_019978 [Phrynocephalus forsythii]